MNDLDRAILNRIQNDFPLTERPFALIAADLGITEEECLRRIVALKNEGVLRYIKPVINAHAIGYSGVLIGCAVDADLVDTVAEIISARTEVSHNYLRKGKLNLWFTFTTDSTDTKESFLGALRVTEGVREVIEFPSEKTYKIGLKLAV